MSKLLNKPVAYILHKYGCRTPDDCEEYNEFLLIEDADKEELEHYIKHNHATPLFSESSIKEKDEVIDKLKKKIDKLNLISARSCHACAYDSFVSEVDEVHPCDSCECFNNWQMKTKG